jgi:hypothetical protein
MNIRDLRIQLETTLTDVLGTYRLANGATTPAIAVRAEGDSLPPGTVVEGLEVVILRDPELEPVRQYRQETARLRWTLYLVDWSGGVPLQTIAGRLIWAYPGTNAVRINVPRGVGPGAQMRVDLLSSAATFEYITIARLALEDGALLLLESGDAIALEVG